VLLVDDNPGDIDLMSAVLGKSKWHFHDQCGRRLFGDRAGVQGASEPDHSGSRIARGRRVYRARRLQRDDKLSTIPVVVLTARDPQRSEQRAFEMGAAAFFQKPADNAELLNVIRATLSQVVAGTNLPS